MAVVNKSDPGWTPEGVPKEKPKAKERPVKESTDKPHKA